MPCTALTCGEGGPSPTKGQGLTGGNPVATLGSKMGFIEEGLDRMWAAVQEGEEAVASRGFIATFKAGNSRKGGDGPVPVSDPPHGTSADLVPYSLEPDTQGLDRAPDPHLADSNGTPTPLMGIPGNLVLPLDCQ
ncbi:hypothetical protein ACKKBG_A06520 [Auxenochlorella protothecoides x Auxenochlorella symbiontica]